MNPAVRSPTGNCIEELNCNWERATVCAFSIAQNVEQKVNFLACMDDINADDPLDAGKKCLAKLSMTGDIASCYNGQAGDDLLSAASKIFNKAFPGRVAVPHVNVDGVQRQASAADIKTGICASNPGLKECSSAKARKCYL